MGIMQAYTTHRSLCMSMLRVEEIQKNVNKTTTEVNGFVVLYLY